ncbi:MAG TPA: DUF4124 domain-containing protein [Burkholderiales bacterium]
MAKALFSLLLLAGASAAQADLYRWIDPQSGSVKYSSVPPPPSQRGVEVIPYREGAAPAPERPPSGPSALELRWRELLAEASAAPPGSPAQQQRLKELAGVSAELDRIDPAGRARRRGEAERMLQRLLGVGR